MLALAIVVDYLGSNRVPFRLFSFPSPESQPPVGHRSADSVVVDTHLLLIDGGPALACTRRGQRVNVPGLRASLRANLVDDRGERAGQESLPWPFNLTLAPFPPLARLFGIPLIMDEALLAAPVLCFAAFSGTDFVELAYDDFARLEQPRIESVAMAGELPMAH